MKTATRSQSARQQAALDRALVTAWHFGFTPTDRPDVRDDHKGRASMISDAFTPIAAGREPVAYDIAERIANLERYEAEKADSGAIPRLFAYERKSRRGEAAITLEAIGLDAAVAEAVMMRAALSIADDEGMPGACICVNTVGDKESSQDYERALATYMRRHGQHIPEAVKELVKVSPYHLPLAKFESERLRAEPPKTMSYLSEQARKHFAEVMEYIESFSVPYAIDHTLIGIPGITSHTIFEIAQDDGTTIAHGFRYSRLARKLGGKRDVPALTMTIRLSGGKERPKKPLPKPRFYLVQLGFGAKAESMHVIDMLRKARITVGHALAKDRLQSQIATAENQGFSHILIIGQKEAYERSVVVRDSETRAQECVPMDRLVAYLKGL